MRASALIPLIILPSLLLAGCTTMPATHHAATPAAPAETHTDYTAAGTTVRLTNIDGRPYSLDSYRDGQGWTRTLPAQEGTGPVALDVRQIGTGTAARIQVHYLQAADHDRQILDVRDRYDFAGNLVQQLRKPAPKISW